MTPGCPGNDPNTPGSAYDMACQYMTTTCAARGMGTAWLTWIWTRSVPAHDTPSRWTKTNYSCTISAADATGGRPAVTRTAIERAFRRIPFSHPNMHIQPEGNLTLVNLPTYYQVRWPTTGYQPGEIATINLLGTTIRIRPTATYTYTYGDGTSTGPTTDTGGPYPHGRIQHTYHHDGTAPVHATAHYTGQYSTGANWQPINITINITGPTTTLAIKQARTHLIAGDT